MLALHGGWLPDAPRHPARVVLWAEQRAGRPRSARRKAPPPAGSCPRHPFAARPEALTEVLLPRCGPEVVGLGRAGEVLARLPTRDGGPLPSPGLAADQPAPGAPALATWRLPALAYEPVPAARLLLALAALEPGPDVQLADDLRFWIAATRFTLELVRRQRFLPTLQPRGEQFLAVWRPLLDEDADHERLAALAAAMPPVCRALSWTPGAPDAPAPAPRRLLRGYVESLTDALARSAGWGGPVGGEADRPVGRAARADRARAGPRSDSVAAAWWAALSDAPLVQAPPQRLLAFRDELRSWTERGREHAADTFRVCLRLSPPAAPPPGPPDDGASGAGTRAAPGDGAWRLEYLLQATDDPSLLVPATDVWRQRGAAARFLNRRLDRPQERLLAGLGRAARLFPPIEASLRQARPEAGALSTAEAHRLLREAAPVLKAGGFGVLVPGLEATLRLRLRLRGAATADRARSAGVAAFTRESLVAYDWELALGDQTLSRVEFEQLARLKEPLVRVRGRWVELDPEQVERTLTLLEQGQDGGALSFEDALRLALAPDAAEGPGLPIESVAAEGWMEALLRDLRRGPRREPAAEPAGFVGRLRPYQQVGVAWLAALRRYGLGACLADDMGLGKTPTLIALLLLERPRGADGRAGVGAPAGARPDGQAAPGTGTAGPPPAGPTLVVCPTSVVGNWRRELARFAPSLRVLVHHGAGRAREDLAAVAARHDVVLSTYALLHRDEAALLAVPWDGVVLDEAQNVKNASTRAAQTVRRLPARWRAALTGTPVENRLSELWSLFQFLSPGYLGSAASFRKRFANPIERANDAAATERLKRLVAPFILRREKSDKAIIQDLPEKQEMTVYCPLTREQATLYEAVVRDSLGEIEAAEEGIQRRGQVLAALTRLKQVCDHPALFLHDKSALAGRSGKLTRLEEMLEEALAVDDRALLFTQYAEMGRLLRGHLEARFGREVLFLHGGTPAAARDRLVARFQRDDRHAPPLFVLSIKAGGTGLNLTRANRVFHFDRWWNPAVENQATDRAYRIGQTRNVQVHKLVCGGTFEEALDQLIERKTALAQAIVGTSEAWITELSTAELRDLFALRGSSAEVLAP